MAPEQWEGRPQDARTDQWALAVVLYELVAGQLPFPADDVAILERQVLTRTPERPAALAPAQYQTLLRALSKNKEDRYPSCVAFIDGLSLSGNVSPAKVRVVQPVSAPEPVRPRRAPLSREAVYIRLLFGTPVFFPLFLGYTLLAWIVWVFFGGWIYLALGVRPTSIHTFCPTSVPGLVFWPISCPLMQIVFIGAIVWLPFAWAPRYYFMEKGAAEECSARPDNVFMVLASAPFRKVFSVVDDEHKDQLEPA